MFKSQSLWFFGMGQNFISLNALLNMESAKIKSQLLLGWSFQISCFRSILGTNLRHPYAKLNIIRVQKRQALYKWYIAYRIYRTSQTIRMYNIEENKSIAFRNLPN